MKYLATLICGLTVIVLFGNAPSIASDCGVRGRVVQIKHRRAAAVVVDAVVIADHHDNGHAGYGHGVGYAPDNSELLAKLFDAYKKEAEDHKATLKAIAAGGKPETLKAALAPRHPGIGVLNARCASCHSEANKSKGKGFAFLTDAGAFIDQGDNAGKVLGAIDYDNGGDMPVGGKLTDSESLKVERFVHSLPPQEEAKAPPKK